MSTTSIITVSALSAPAAGASDKDRSSPWGLVGLSLAMLLSSLGTSGANVALPALTQAFHASFQAVQWVVLAYLLAVTTLIVSAGQLGDLIGRRRLLLLGIVVFTAGATLCGAAPNLPWLIVGRAVQGLGAASMMALTLAFVGETVSKEKAGAAVGLLGTMSAVGTALGPSLGGVLLSSAGWRALFLVNVPLGLLAFVLARRHLRSDRAAPPRERRPFDLIGTVLLAGALGAYALALTLGRGSFGVLNASLLLGSVAAAVVFVVYQQRVAFPLLPLGLLRSPELSAGLALAAITSLVVMTTLVVGPFYLTRGLGLDAATTGLVLTVGPFVAALTGVPAGRWVDRLGARAMTLVGLLGMAGGCLTLAFAPVRGIAGYIMPVALLTAGYALFQTANNTAMLAASGPERRGTVAGLVSLARNLGLLTGASAMGAVFVYTSAGDHAAAPPEAIAMGMRATFATAALVVIAGLFLVGRGKATATNA